MEKIWLAGRRRPIAVRGPARTLAVARALFAAFDTSGWAGLPGVEWRAVPLDEGVEVWSDDRWRVTATPGTHGVPVIAIRVEHRSSRRVVVYSADTERSAAVVRLARGADVLVHECTGAFPGHASAEEAAEVAREADVESLVLVHVPADIDRGAVERAREVFPRLRVGVDGAVFRLPELDVEA